MKSHDVTDWQHSHVFLGERHDRNERRTWLVVVLTAIMMVAEIVAGTIFNSMALLADGWHMATHVGALSISAFAYRFARIHAHNEAFTFGTGKVGDLAGFTSAVALCLVAVLIGWEAFDRLRNPVPVAFDQAILVAALGLAINVVCAVLLWDRPHSHASESHDAEGHDHAAEDHHHDHTHHHDHNLRSAFLHVVADALTSVLALVALFAGRHWGAEWLDPVVGMIGAVVIARWSHSLMKQTGRILLDMQPDPDLAGSIRRVIEDHEAEDKVSDLHLWRIGPGHYAAILSVVTHSDTEPAQLKERLKSLHRLTHVTIEVQRCRH